MSECNCCLGSGRMVRDPDIGTDQECFVCDGTGIADHQEIESLTRENAQLKSVIAEQKEEIQSLAWYKLEGGGLEASVSCQLAEQSTLIEKLGKALRKETQIYIENDPEDGPPEDMAEALAELAKWREGK